MNALLSLLAAADQFAPQIFRTPSPLFFGNGWWLLLLPLSLAIAIVYKSVKCQSMSRVPREAAQLFVIILIVMALTAGALAGLVRLLESAK